MPQEKRQTILGILSPNLNKITIKNTDDLRDLVSCLQGDEIKLFLNHPILLQTC